MLFTRLCAHILTRNVCTYVCTCTLRWQMTTGAFSLRFLIAKTEKTNLTMFGRLLLLMSRKKKLSKLLADCLCCSFSMDPVSFTRLCAHILTHNVCTYVCTRTLRWQMTTGAFSLRFLIAKTEKTNLAMFGRLLLLMSRKNFASC